MIPSLSHERITEAETLASSATSPIFRYPWRVFAGADFDGARPVWVRVLKVSLDKQEMDSLTLRDYSKVRCCCKRICCPRARVHNFASRRGSMFRFACRFFGRVSLLSLLLAMLACSALAQGTGGRINGRITDPSGAVIPEVTVTITNEATGVSNHTQSNKSGDYSFPTVAVGTYTIEFEAPGFKKLTRKQVALDLNQTLTVNGMLQLGAATETVEVTSEAPLIDTSSTQLGATVDSLIATQLPLNTRDTYQLLQLQPGVMSNVGGSNSIAYGSDQPGVVSVNGGRGRSNNFNVNGGDANDLFANLPTVQPSPDSIAEFRVLTNTFDAEYGRNSGAVINVVTKSGTNEFHGNAFEFFRNSVLNAQGYFNVVKPQFQQNQFGGTFGGPIKKDRAFFFLSYEGRRIKQGIPSAQFYVPNQKQRNGDFS